MFFEYRAECGLDFSLCLYTVDLDCGTAFQSGFAAAPKIEDRSALAAE